MTSIIESIISSLDAVSADYTANVRLPTQQLAALGGELRESGEYILPFSPENRLTTTSLAAIDGGRATQQMASGDLVVVGATVGESLLGVKRYPDGPTSESYATVVPHTSKVDGELAGRVMSALELRVLSQVDTDYKIIDGAYLGNVSEVLFGFISDNKLVVDNLLGYCDDGFLQGGLDEVLCPPRDNSSKVIAVSKSDSSFVYSKMLLKDREELSSLISDRNLASYFLQPGEFLAPRAMISNPMLIRSLESKQKFLSPEVRQITDGKADLLRKIGSEATEEEVLWTTYFKPTAWLPESRAVKIEFTYYETPGFTVQDRARQLIEIVNSDIVDKAILEPYSQYLADRRAKEVSVAMDIVKNRLLNDSESGAEAYGLIKGYRT